MSAAVVSWLSVLIMIGLISGSLETLIKLSDRECGCDDFE